MRKTQEWGKFFPPQIDPFAYNESAAQDFFPLTKDEAIKMGYKWRDEDKKEYTPQPESLSCEKCGKNYRLIPQELKFYKTNNLPTPKSCPTCRHLERFRSRNTYKLYSRTCDNCKTPIQTTYPETSNNIVYCEKCYLDIID
jgi:hypothetical protein